MPTLTAPKLKGLDVERFARIRQKTEEICKPLLTEDYVVQSCNEVSPPKWHLAHTSWFFEHFLLARHIPDYEHFDHGFHYLFNSYYESEIDELFDKGTRGTAARPTVTKIYEFRAHVTNGMIDLLSNHLPTDQESREKISLYVNIGLFHEEQHQELLLMDIKHIFASSYTKPAYLAPPLPTPDYDIPDLEFISFAGGITEIGYSGDEFFADNETPRHKVFMNPYGLSNRLITCGEYLEFIEDGGYQDSRYWLSDGWQKCQDEGWKAPLYWRKGPAGWEIFTLHGMQKLRMNEPVIHISFYEADAFARWKGYRLPTEYELEYVSQDYDITGNFLEENLLHPMPAKGDGPFYQFFGSAWEWTQTPYQPYPGFRTLFEGVGEYNGKFMCNQMVMRGGCALTPVDHMRKTYRNFYRPENRWQMSGIRLARDY